MSDLITILIILAAIISFLNKIFGQKKQQQQTRSQPVPGQQPKEWIPPWFEPDEAEAQFPRSREQDFEWVEDTEQKRHPRERQQPKKAVPIPAVVSEKKVVQPKIVEATELEIKPAKGFKIELASRDDLKRGIVLAEILGPCRAKRRHHRI